VFENVMISAVQKMVEDTYNVFSYYHIRLDTVHCIFCFFQLQINSKPRFWSP